MGGWSDSLGRLLCRWSPTQSRHNWTNEWINKASVSYCPYWRLIVRFLLFLPFSILSLSVELTSWAPSISLLQMPFLTFAWKTPPFLLSNRKQHLISSYAVHSWSVLLIDFASSYLDIEYPTSSFYSGFISSPLLFSRDHDGLIERTSGWSRICYSQWHSSDQYRFLLGHHCRQCSNAGEDLSVEQLFLLRGCHACGDGGCE